ncbi:helix-turn-helix transcriptional regulator [Streptomyces sp. JH010]|uniref:helix-turn-helix domain-containing protein n=1 Tax=unclassified Streptomyces TaxID=2593676 RepID=UPI001F4787C6|nr:MULTISPECIES: helix-turn-helix transcriptional regulator [unclassified Streptomyces]MDF6060488.1 helix-turn-helix transcriptional regulator [Streptomyces sp. JH010]
MTDRAPVRDALSIMMDMPLRDIGGYVVRADGAVCEGRMCICLAHLSKEWLSGGDTVITEMARARAGSPDRRVFPSGRRADRDAFTSVRDVDEQERPPLNRPPFSPDVALSARRALGMSPQEVAEQMNVCGVPTDVSLVHAWESGEYGPAEHELIALADVLWCRTTELMGIGEPRTLTQYRLARQFTTAKLARSVGMDTVRYERAEEQGVWPGDERQTAALLRLLNLTPLQLSKVTVQVGPSWSAASMRPRSNPSRARSR